MEQTNPDPINDDAYRDLVAERRKTNDNQRRILLAALEAERKAAESGSQFATHLYAAITLEPSDVASAMGLERRKLVVTSRFGGRGWGRTRYPKGNPRRLWLTDRGRELAKTLPPLCGYEQVEMAAVKVNERLRAVLDAYKLGQNTERLSEQLLSEVYALRKVLHG